MLFPAVAEAEKVRNTPRTNDSSVAATQTEEDAEDDGDKGVLLCIPGLFEDHDGAARGVRSVQFPKLKGLPQLGTVSNASTISAPGTFRDLWRRI